MKTSIIPVFIPHIGCPYRCVFCNQWQITGHQGVPGPEEITAMINQYTRPIQEKRHWEIAFYGGSFTAIPGELQEKLLRPAYEALQSGQVDALRCSTRPDCISPAVLERLQAYGMKTVELGVQSMDEAVLQQAKRGHTAQDVVAATALLKQYGFTVGHQLMPGLPGEDWESLRQTTAAILRLKPDMARIYPVVVLDNTELAQQYRQGTYQPLSIHEGVCRAAYMKQEFLQQGIVCIRTGLQATEELDGPASVLAGAYTPAMGELVDTKRYQQQLFRFLDSLPPQKVTISYARCDTSRVRGLRNVTVRRSRLRYDGRAAWQEEANLEAHTIRIRTADGSSYFLSMDSGTVNQ